MLLKEPSPRCTALSTASGENHGAAPISARDSPGVPGSLGENDRFASKWIYDLSESPPMAAYSNVGSDSDSGKVQNNTSRHLQIHRPETKTRSVRFNLPMQVPAREFPCPSHGARPRMCQCRFEVWLGTAPHWCAHWWQPHRGSESPTSHSRRTNFLESILGGPKHSRIKLCQTRDRLWCH